MTKHNFPQDFNRESVRIGVNNNVANKESTKTDDYNDIMFKETGWHKIHEIKRNNVSTFVKGLSKRS